MLMVDEEYAAAMPELVPGRYVAICVTDTGAGMTARGHRPRVRAVLHDQGTWAWHRPGA